MKNRYLEKFDKIVMVRVVGSNINNYLRRVIKRKINIIKLIPVSYKEVYLILKYSDYLKLIKYKSIYEVSVVKRMGKLTIIDKLKKNYILFIFILLGIFFLFFLSRIVFNIEVIHQDKGIRKLIYSELNRYNVRKYSFKKSYNELEKIEDSILNRNKDKLEWIEIIENGTKYTVRVEDRKINDVNNKKKYTNVISIKDAVIVRIDAKSGEKVKNVNDYVKKGDIVISGNVSLPNSGYVKSFADGLVYGEVWYQVDIDYPFVYQETDYTGRKRHVFVINYFGREYGLFQFNKYRTFDRKNKYLFCSNYLDICFINQRQYEVNIRDEVYTFDVVKYKAIDYVKDKVMKDNNRVKKVMDIKVLDSLVGDKSIRLKLFVRVIEDIGKIVEINDNNIS